MKAVFAFVLLCSFALLFGGEPKPKDNSLRGMTAAEMLSLHETGELPNATTADKPVKLPTITLANPVVDVSVGVSNDVVVDTELGQLRLTQKQARDLAHRLESAASGHIEHALSEAMRKDPIFKGAKLYTAYSTGNNIQRLSDGHEKYPHIQLDTFHENFRLAVREHLTEVECVRVEGKYIVFGQGRDNKTYLVQFYTR